MHPTQLFGRTKYYGVLCTQTFKTSSLSAEFQNIEYGIVWSTSLILHTLRKTLLFWKSGCNVIVYERTVRLSILENKIIVSI